MPLTNLINQKFVIIFLKIISGKLNIKGNVYDIIEAYMNYKNKHLKTFKQEFENKTDDYRDEDLEEEKLNQQQIR